MAISDVVGFIVTLFLFLYLFLSPIIKEQKARRKLNEPQRHQRPLQQHQKMVKTLQKQTKRGYQDDDEELSPVPKPPAPKKPKVVPIVQSQNIEAPIVSSNISANVGAYRIRHTPVKSRGAMIIDQFNSLQDVYVLHELLGPPKALRRDKQFR